MTERKGLNVPQKRYKTPIDLLFEELASFLEIDESSSLEALDQYFLKLNNDTNIDDIEKVNSLIDKTFEFIFEIQTLAANIKTANSQDAEKSNLISISLHDLKYFNELINLVIIQLIYPLLPIDVGVPLNQRRLNSFNDKSKKFQYKRYRNNPKNVQLLTKIVLNFEKLFSKNDDLKDLLIKGSGLIDIFTCLIVLIHSDKNKSQFFLEKFQSFENQSDTYNLYSIYTLLLQSTTNINYKNFISFKLSSLTVSRSNGVITLIDFIVGIRDDEDINIEKFNTVNKILLATPKTITKVEYFSNIFQQIYEILVFIDRPILLSVVLNFIEKIYKLNKRIVHDFLFRLIWTKLNPKVSEEDYIVSEKELNDSINVLISLTKQSSSEFLNELFYPIFLNLWAFFNYLSKKKLDYSSIVLRILTSFFKVTKNSDFMKDIILNLVKFQINEELIFVTTIENNLTSIQKKPKLSINGSNGYSNEDFFNDIETSISSIVTLLKEIDDKDLVREQFLIVLNRWILQNNKANEESILDEENPFLILIDLKLLEKLNEVFKDSLLDKPEEVLLMIKNILLVKVNNKEEDLLAKEVNTGTVDSDDEDSDDEEMEDQQETDSDNLNILLELLSAIISETTPVILKSKHEETLVEISKLLENFPKNKYCITLSTRIRELLDNEIKVDQSETSDELSKDKELLEKALTNMNDPLVPIRAHGLYLLRQLITKKSEILSLDHVIELHLLQLHDTEPFIYLNVIKSLNELLEFSESETLVKLMDYYFEFNVNEEKSKQNSVDDRLKIGEVLLNFIQRKNQLLIATSNASDPSGTSNAIDQLIHGTITQINNFELDNKLRMSAMSILGEALHVNPIGLLKFVKDAVDCSIGILELEEDITMKRSAVVLINDLAMNDIELIPKGFGERIKTLLGYVRVNTKDYLLIEQIDKTLLNIDEAVKEKLRVDYEMPNQFKSFKI